MLIPSTDSVHRNILGQAICLSHGLRNQDIRVVVDRPFDVVVLVQDEARGVVVGVFGVGHVGPVHDDDPVPRSNQLGGRTVQTNGA